MDRSWTNPRKTLLPQPSANPVNTAKQHRPTGSDRVRIPVAVLAEAPQARGFWLLKGPDRKADRKSSAAGTPPGIRASATADSSVAPAGNPPVQEVAPRCLARRGGRASVPCLVAPLDRVARIAIV